MSRSLILESLVKSYGTKRALDVVSAQWQEGQMIALVGANGGGKSTLLKVLAGVLAADGGKILGQSSFSMAYMPDRVAFSRGWTAESWLRMVASWKKVPRRRIAEVLEEAGLAEVRRKPVATFSQGMLRRLLYAQTRLRDADLILLDEPEGGLDPAWILRLEEEFSRLRAEGRTVIFSTHWLDLAVDRADELVVLSQGTAVAQNPTSEWRPLDPLSRRRRLVELIGAVR